MHATELSKALTKQWLVLRSGYTLRDSTFSAARVAGPGLSPDMDQATVPSSAVTVIAAPEADLPSDAPHFNNIHAQKPAGEV
jgi:hypothetical protein